ncbi:cytochrome c oxidase subunit 3 [Methylorubrum thiocyanatum]|jgi:cytochrome c oxidase subunit III|uniref:cytochrome c oxidase subunit 3 n=1 Tax=Methylorubrum thiocyanatum TaxID=47958 RepID=UPI0035C7A080
MADPMADSADAILAPDARPLPIGTVAGTRSSGWLGMALLIATEASVFAYLIFAYFYTAALHTGAWPPQGLPPLTYAGPAFLVALASAASVRWAVRALERDRPRQSAAGLGLTLVLGLAATALLGLDASMQAGLTPGAYRSLYLTILGVHLAHLVAGLVGLAVLSLWTALGYVGPVRSAPVLIGAFYWSFVVAAEAAVFVTLHLSPHLG